MLLFLRRRRLEVDGLRSRDDSEAWAANIGNRAPPFDQGVQLERATGIEPA